MNNYFELFWEFFTTDFQLRYKHSYLGLLWVVLKPLSYFVILYTIWTALIHTEENYAFYLFIGILTINFFNEGITFGMQSMINKAHIILKINFPREIVVFSSIMVAFMNFLINIGIFIGIMVFSGVPLHYNLLVILGMIILMTLFISGISLFLSVISIRFQDIKHLVELLLQLVFWSTPVVFELSRITDRNLQSFILLNPLTTIIEGLRFGFLQKVSIVPAENYLWTFGLVVILNIVGYWFFRKNVTKIAEYF